MNKFLKVLLGTSLYALDQSDRMTRKNRDRVAANLGDLRDTVQDQYETAADRVARASRAIRGEDSHAVGNVLRLVAGVGIGIGIGLLFAPASGEATRSAIGNKVQDIGDKVREQFSSEEAFATTVNG